MDAGTARRSPEGRRQTATLSLDGSAWPPVRYGQWLGRGRQRPPPGRRRRWLPHGSFRGRGSCVARRVDWIAANLRDKARTRGTEDVRAELPVPESLRHEHTAHALEPGACPRCRAKPQALAQHLRDAHGLDLATIARIVPEDERKWVVGEQRRLAAKNRRNERVRFFLRQVHRALLRDDLGEARRHLEEALALLPKVPAADCAAAGLTSHTSTDPRTAKKSRT